MTLYYLLVNNKIQPFIIGCDDLSTLSAFGDLLENVAKDEFDRFSTHSGKLQHIQDDDVVSIRRHDHLKAEVKQEYVMAKHEEDEIPVLKPRHIAQILRFREPENTGSSLKIRLDFIEPPIKRRRPPELQFQKFRHEDVWDPARQLRLKAKSDQICIANMVQLPAERHVLNKPRPYKPIEPLKKKMYRPPVPRVFKGGFDQFLNRRAVNKAATQANQGEIDLAVWTIDQVVNQCYINNIIPLFIYNQFLNINGHHQTRKFVDKWLNCQLHQFDFKRTCFTLLDHRRLSQLLLHLFPKKYTLGSYQALHHDVKEFITKTYYLPNDDYVQAYLLLDQISECTWWSDIKLRLQSHDNIDHSNYFKVKQTINKPPLPAEMQYDKEKKSMYIKQILGEIRILDSERELEKILSMKYKNIQKGTYSESSYNRNDEEEDFSVSHDRGSEFSEGESSVRGQNSRTGPDWSKIFNQQERKGDVFDDEE